MSDLMGSGNSRTAQNARWLKTVPERATQLVLALGDTQGGFEVVQRWAVDRVDPSHTPAEIEDTILGYLEEIRQSCQGALRWLDDRETVLSTRRLRCRYESVDADGGPEHVRFDGNLQSVLAQTQAHQQAFVRTFVDMVKYSVAGAFERVEQAVSREAAALAKVEQLQAEKLELEAALLEAGDAGEGAEVMREGLGLVKLALLKQHAAGKGTKPASGE